MEKVFVLLAKQENISFNQAKKLIDNGQVYLKDKKVKIARALVNKKSKFKVYYPEKIEKIFEDENVLVVNKPAFITSEEISKKYKIDLLHRLDRDTSGILILVKNKEFQKKAIEEFKKQNVYKEYIAMVDGIVAEEVEINKPILTVKQGNKAYSKISKKGKEAITIVKPILAYRSISKVKAIIKTGRTHQIRVHLKSINHPIIGDEIYGKRPYYRLMLHNSKMKLFDYEFNAKEPKEFRQVEEKFSW